MGFPKKNGYYSVKHQKKDVCLLTPKSTEKDA